MQVFSDLQAAFLCKRRVASTTAVPADICSISTHFLRATPSFSLKRQAFFKSRPQECYFCSLNNPSQISETARTAGSCDRRGMRTTPRLCPAFPPQRPKSLDFALNGARATPAVKRSSLPRCSVAAACFADAPARWRNVRFCVPLWVRAWLGGENGTNRQHGRDGLGLAF